VKRHPKELDMTDPLHLLLVGTGPGLGAAIARRFARAGEPAASTS
jgi:NAD(P)-dependent dehydrogenase (short-subunit alcohol dehydrogenase family)